MLVIGGTVGVGKTTVAEMISNFYKSPVFYESVEDNPILEKFYADPKAWAFPLQIYFFQSRYTDIQKALMSGNHLAVMDRSIYEDHLFTLMNYERGNMTKEHYDTYLKLFDVMMNEWKGEKKRPELFIYLRASFDTVLKRMQKRNRSFEMSDELLEYFKDLHSRYDDWVYKHYDASSVLVIDMDVYDVTIPEHRDIVMSKIKVCVDAGFKIVSPDDDIYFYKYVTQKPDGSYMSERGRIVYKIGETVHAAPPPSDGSRFYMDKYVSGYPKDYFKNIPGFGAYSQMIELRCKRSQVVTEGFSAINAVEAEVVRVLTANEMPPKYKSVTERRAKNDILIKNAAMKKESVKR